MAEEQENEQARTFTVSAGFLTVKSPYFICITKNIKLKNNLSLFFSSGMTIINYPDSPYAYSTGLSYNQDKILFNFSAMKANLKKQLYTSFSLAHQWELIPYMPNVFLSLGIGKSRYLSRPYPILSIDYRPYPILSIDYRF